MLYKSKITTKFTIYSEIEIVKEFNYLGLLLTKTGNFKRAIKTLADKGTKAMYEILKRGKFHNLFISCRLDLFNKVVNPILLYGCELWGLSNCDIIERVHLKYCKLLLISNLQLQIVFMVN